jgi:hypothetical protein
MYKNLNNGLNLKKPKSLKTHSLGTFRLIHAKYQNKKSHASEF